VIFLADHCQIDILSGITFAIYEINMLTRSDDLEILLSVVDSGGFSAAAEALDIQVAKVSRSVSKLETQLG
jgi:hypothetical protein